jgi:hypothetical protein
MSNIKYVNLEGAVFGKLKVVSPADRGKQGNFRWLCICECGNTTKVSGSQLHGTPNRKPQTKCQDCRNKELSATPASVESAVNHLFGNYKVCARNRGIEFSLNRIDFVDLIYRPCHYCGRPPSQFCRKGKAILTYSGVDRQDNSLGYDVHNCVPCCKQCNQAKMNYPKVEFLLWLKRAYEHSCLMR